MGALAPLRIGRRPVRTRVLVLFRADPAVLEPLLPPKTRPRLHAGCGVLGLCYTRLGTLGGRFLPQRLNGSTDHLSYRIAVEFEGRAGSREGTWVLRRETSSWLRARCGGRLQRGDYRRSAFEVEQDALAFGLRVRHGDVEELFLRAGVTLEPTTSLFGSTRGAEEFLTLTRSIRPVDVIAPEADDLDLAEGRVAPEPLQVHELRCAYLADSTDFPAGSLRMDSAFRLVTRRLVPVVRRSRALESALTEGGPSPAVTA